MPRPCLLLLLAFAVKAAAQIPAAPPAARAYAIHAGRMIDGKSDVVQSDVLVLVQGDRIVAVGPRSQLASRVPANAETIDLGGATILPGLIDNHTHVLLQGDITAADYDEQLLKESIPYRTIRATAAVRTALMNGFTAMRDLETEGAMYADVDVKTAINRGVIPGPRMFVSTRAMAPTGMYPLLGYSWELKMPEGVQIVDGPDDIRKAVREQAKYGADWIKFYADRRYYMARTAAAIVGELHRRRDEGARRRSAPAGTKVAAHAMGWDGIDAALRAGVNTIEHGDGTRPTICIDRMVKQKVYWCPTIYVGVYVAAGPRRQSGRRWSTWSASLSARRSRRA